MRLINEDEILSYIEHVKHNGLGKTKSLEYITKFIKKTQTAYDPEELARKADEMRKTACSKSDWSTVACERGKVRAFDEAIEIVKNGVIRSNDGVKGGVK